MASTVSRDMRVEATVSSPKHAPKKIVTDVKSAIHAEVLSPKRKPTPLQTPEKKPQTESKPRDTVKPKRVPFGKKLDDNETKMVKSSLKKKKQSETVVLKTKKELKEYKLNEVRSQQTQIPTTFSSGIDAPNKVADSQIKRANLPKSKRPLSEKLDREPIKKEKDIKGQQTVKSEHVKRMSKLVSGKELHFQSKYVKRSLISTETKQGEKSEQSPKESFTKEKALHKYAPANQAAKDAVHSGMAEEGMQNLDETIGLVNVEDSVNPLHTQSALTDVSTSRLILAQPASNDYSSEQEKRAASAPISSFVDAESSISGRRSSGPPRAPLPDKALDRPGLERTKGPSSLPSSPSRMRSQAPSGSVQLLTSEVFTRTVDSSGGIEVIFRQPEPSRRPFRGEQAHSDGGELSMIDTTDSSLSDSVALPSSSSDHDLSVDTSYRLRTTISPGSPKFSRRARDSMSPKTRQSDIAECTTVMEGDVSEADGSPARSSSTPTRFVDRAGVSRTPNRAEDRLSPILDVHSVTPPRLKHKFVYASSDEEDSPPPQLGKPDRPPESSVHSMPLPSEISTKPVRRKPSQDKVLTLTSVLELESPLEVAQDSFSLEILEEDVSLYNDEVPTVSTSGSDLDHALLESIQLRAICEEEATDEDPDNIPNDDSCREEYSVTARENNIIEAFEIDSSIMEPEDSTIPVISITASDDTNQMQHYNDPYKGSPEPLTDMEDIDHDLDKILKGSLQLINDDGGGITDAELVDASDDEKDPAYIPKIAVELRDIIDYGGTYEELVRVGSPSTKKGKLESSMATSSSDKLGNFLNVHYEQDGLTDHEDFNMSDEEDNAEEESQEVHENIGILNGLTDDGRVDITDRLSKSPIPSPAVTPEPGDKRRQRRGKGKKPNNSRKKRTNYNLSPRSLSPHLSDITDTEIVYSDSEEDQFTTSRPLSPHERRRQMKHIKESEQLRNKQKLVKAVTVDSSFPELEISSVHISEKVPVKELVSESDNDNYEVVPKQHVLYAPKKKTLLMEVAGALMKDTFASTDIEHFEGSNESDDDEASQISDYHYNAVDGQYGSVREKEIAKDALHLPKQDKVILTDTEDIETEEESGQTTQGMRPFIQITSQEDSTEEDEFETTDTEYLAAAKELRARAWKEENYEIRFIEMEGRQRPLAITPDLPRSSSSILMPPPQVLYPTDTEDLDGDSDVDVSRELLAIRSPDKDGGLTDTELFEGEDEISRPKSPEPSDDENSQALPEPTREMILMKEDPCGRPVSVVLPLGNVEPGGLKPPRVELEGSLSEIEDMVTDDDDDLHTERHFEPCPTPEISDIDGGIIHTSEVMKVQKSKLKVMSGGVQEPLTDTEDVFLSVSGKRKKSKTKLKLGLDLKLENIKKDLTDTEDLVFSDTENCKIINDLRVPRVETDPTTDVDDVDYSAEEDILDTQRYNAMTPEHLRELGITFTTLKEGTGHFTEEARQSFLSLSSVPLINTISPTPDIHFATNTDTEDMMTSADEEGFSRAETMTPYDTGLELEDHSSVVYMKHTRKFDLEAPEEAIHVKGSVDFQESYTDVEDLGISEDERPRPPEQLFVNDTVNEVCVCLASEIDQDESVCVCVSKEHGGLSLVWNSKNLTDAKQHRDWAEEGKPDSTLDPSSKDPYVEHLEGLHGRGKRQTVAESTINEENPFKCDKSTLSSSQVLHKIDLILASDINFADITPTVSLENLSLLEEAKNNRLLRDLDSKSSFVNAQQPASATGINERVPSEKCATASNTNRLFDFDSNIIDRPSEIVCRRRNLISDSKQEALLSKRSSQNYDTDFEDSLYTVPGSNTESFSELRFSTSDTHSEFNYSDSEEESSVDITLSRSDLLKSSKPISYCPLQSIDDTTGILYEMSEQINKVPKLLSGSGKQKECPVNELTSIKCHTPNSNSDDSLEGKMLRYFSQCDKLALSGNRGSKGQEELGQLEAAVDRMLTQVELQESMLREDPCFVPLVIQRKAVKALPMLVDSLNLSPLVQRRAMQQLKNKCESDFLDLSKDKCVKLESPITQKSENRCSGVSCSISELERSVDRLLNEVKKEEEKLSVVPPDSDRTPTSTDISSEDDSYRVWWEGAYRSLPRHSARKKLTTNSVNRPKLQQRQIPSITSSSDDSDTSKESIKLFENKTPHSKLMVKTFESGKSTVEIRTSNEFVKSNEEVSDSKFCQMFHRARSEAYSAWNRSLPSLVNSPPPHRNSLIRSLGSDDSINYVKYLEPSECIQYFTPEASMEVDSMGYCTWTNRISLSGGSTTLETSPKSVEIRKENISVTSNDSEKESKYQFTMSVPDKQTFTESVNSIQSFLDAEKNYNDQTIKTKPDNLATLAYTDMTSSSETEESQSRSESEPKSDKSFVGKMSKRLFGVFKKDDRDKGESKKAKKKRNKKENTDEKYPAYEKTENTESVERDEVSNEAKKTINESKDTTDSAIKSVKFNAEEQATKEKTPEKRVVEAASDINVDNEAKAVKENKNILQQKADNIDGTHSIKVDAVVLDTVSSKETAGAPDARLSTTKNYVLPNLSEATDVSFTEPDEDIIHDNTSTNKNIENKLQLLNNKPVNFTPDLKKDNDNANAAIAEDGSIILIDTDKVTTITTTKSVHNEKNESETLIIVDISQVKNPLQDNRMAAESNIASVVGTTSKDKDTEELLQIKSSAKKILTNELKIDTPENLVIKDDIITIKEESRDGHTNSIKNETAENTTKSKKEKSKSFFGSFFNKSSDASNEEQPQTLDIGSNKLSTDKPVVVKEPLVDDDKYNEKDNGAKSSVKSTERISIHIEEDISRNSNEGNKENIAQIFSSGSVPSHQSSALESGNNIASNTDVIEKTTTTQKEVGRKSDEKINDSEVNVKTPKEKSKSFFSGLFSKSEDVASKEKTKDSVSTVPAKTKEIVNEGSVIDIEECKNDTSNASQLFDIIKPAKGKGESTNDADFKNTFIESQNDVSEQTKALRVFLHGPVKDDATIEGTSSEDKPLNSLKGVSRDVANEVEKVEADIIVAIEKPAAIADQINLNNIKQSTVASDLVEEISNNFTNLSNYKTNGGSGNKNITTIVYQDSVKTSNDEAKSFLGSILKKSDNGNVDGRLQAANASKFVDEIDDGATIKAKSEVVEINLFKSEDTKEQTQPDAKVTSDENIKGKTIDVSYSSDIARGIKHEILDKTTPILESSIISDRKIPLKLIEKSFDPLESDNTKSLKTMIFEPEQRGKSCQNDEDRLEVTEVKSAVTNIKEKSDTLIGDMLNKAGIDNTDTNVSSVSTSLLQSAEETTTKSSEIVKDLQDELVTKTSQVGRVVTEKAEQSLQLDKIEVEQSANDLGLKTKSIADNGIGKVVEASQGSASQLGKNNQSISKTISALNDHTLSKSQDIISKVEEINDNVESIVSKLNSSLNEEKFQKVSDDKISSDELTNETETKSKSILEVCPMPNETESIGSSNIIESLSDIISEKGERVLLEDSTRKAVDDEIAVKDKLEVIPHGMDYEEYTSTHVGNSENEILKVLDEETVSNTGGVLKPEDRSDQYEKAHQSKETNLCLLDEISGSTNVINASKVIEDKGYIVHTDSKTMGNTLHAEQLLSTDKNNEVNAPFFNEQSTSVSSSTTYDRGNQVKLGDETMKRSRTDVGENVQNDKKTSDDDKLNSILIDMLIEQECLKSSAEDKLSSTSQSPDLATLREKHDTEESEKITKSLNVGFKTTASFGKVESLISDGDLKGIDDATEGGQCPYVTTPTMQRRKIGGSQRLSREERPAMREVTHVTDYSSSEEDETNYIVTEPSERQVTFQVESEDESLCKVSDSGSELELEVTEMTPSPVPTLKKQECTSDERIEERLKPKTKDDKNVKKVERRFERMASETLDADPVVKFTADRDFQRMVSQLSSEEVDACLSQWDEGGLTPSEELDSTRDTVEGDGDLDPDIEALPEAHTPTNPFYPEISQWADFEQQMRKGPSSIFWAFDSAPTSAEIQPSELDIPIKSVRSKGNSLSDQPPTNPNSLSLGVYEHQLRINTLGQSYRLTGLTAWGHCQLVDSPLGRTRSNLTGDSTEEASKSPVQSAARARPQLKYDISMDEEPEVDMREHDWRFDLPVHHEGEEALLDLAAGLQETKGSGAGSGPSGAK